MMARSTSFLSGGGDRQVATWIAGITAAAAIGYVVLGSYLPSFKWTRKMDKDAVPGLYNRYGNDCFANCVIQSLAGIPSFREYLKERVDRDTDGKLKLSRALMELLAGVCPQELANVVLNLPARKDKTRSVERVILALEFMYETRISRNQQDSQEFLHLIHEALSLEDAEIKKRHPEKEKLIIPLNPFEGELSTQIECQRCRFTTPWKNEAFTELSVAVPSKWSCTLLECFASLITTDSISDYACPLCTLQNTLLSLELTPTKPASLLRATSHLRSLQNKYKTLSEPTDLDIDAIILPASVQWKRLKVPAIKRTVVSKAPKVMAVHLVRSIYDRGAGAGRNSCAVSFDVDIRIPLGGKAVEEKVEEDVFDDVADFYETYRLMSVVTHKGVHDNGHYICYRRRKRERKHPSVRRSGSINDSEKEEVDGTEEETHDEIKVLEQGVSALGLESDSRTKWWEISDEVVNGVHKEDVLSKRKGVYILFYEKRS